MIKQVIALSALAVILTGCVVSPYDDDYSRDGRNHNGHYDRDHRWNNDRDGRPDWRNQNRYGQKYDRQGDGRPYWNRENQQ